MLLKIIVSVLAACVFTTFAMIPAAALIVLYDIKIEPETIMYCLLIGSFVVAMLMDHEKISK